METIQKRQKILDVLAEIEEELDKNPETIPEHVFQTLEAFCKLVYLWRYSEKKPGWTKPLGYFMPDEEATVESRFLDLDGQTGGAITEDKEFMEEYSVFQKKLTDIGTQWREVINALGVVATNTMNTLVKSLPTDKSDTTPSASKDMSNGILSFFSTLIESLRIWVAYSLVDSTTYRVLLSFSQGILDTVRGNIRQALLSSLGVFGQHGFYISILTRFMLNIIETVSPELPRKLEMDFYKNMKTMTAASLLWGYFTFAPLTLKHNINQIFEEVKKIAKEQDIALKPFTDEIKKQASKKEITIPEFPLENVPSYEDIQLLGSLLAVPEIACMSSFKKLIHPLRSIFTLRLTLDLLNIPTGKAEIDDLCIKQKNTTRKNTGKQQKGGKSKRGKTHKSIAV